MTNKLYSTPQSRVLAATDAEDTAAHSALSPTYAVVTAVSDAGGTTVEVCRPGKVQAVEAFVAASCLLRPEVGDVVLISPASASANVQVISGWWLLAVLRRGQEGLATLQVPGAQAVSLSAPSLQLHGDQQIAVRGDNLVVETQRASISTKFMQLTAGTVNAVAQQLTIIADKLDSLARDMLLRCRNRVSNIDEVDALQTGQLSIQVNETLIAEGTQVVINAKDNVRIDGQRILMG